MNKPSTTEPVALCEAITPPGFTIPRPAGDSIAAARARLDRLRGPIIRDADCDKCQGDGVRNGPDSDELYCECGAGESLRRKEIGS
jgi:hypothetical protein